MSASNFQLTMSNSNRHFINGTAFEALDFRQREEVKFVNKYLTKIHRGNYIRLLDVGCYTGKCTRRFSAAERVGIEVNPQIAAQAGLVLSEVHAFDIEDGSAWRHIPQHSFDVVVSFDTLEHCLNTDTVLSNINRVLMPGGLFLFGVPNVCQPAAWLLYGLFDLPPKNGAGYGSVHVRDFSARSVRYMLKRHGFKIDKQMGSYWPAWFCRASVWLARMLPARFGGSVWTVCHKQDEVYFKDEASVLPSPYPWKLP